MTFDNLFHSNSCIIQINLQNHLHPMNDIYFSLRNISIYACIISDSFFRSDKVGLTLPYYENIYFLLLPSVWWCFFYLSTGRTALQYKYWFAKDPLPLFLSLNSSLSIPHFRSLMQRNLTQFLHYNKDMSNPGWRQIVKGRGGCSPLVGEFSPPPSGKNCLSVGEFSTENCVVMHRKIPSVLLFSPTCRGTQSPRRANPGATPLSNRVVLHFRQLALRS